MSGDNYERAPKDEIGTGRWPANLIHDGSDEVMALFPESKGQQGDVKGTEASRTGGEGTNCYGEYGRVPAAKRGDSGSAARFYYCAKASKSDRGAYNNHATVKPTDLMRYLCRLVTPPGGVILDPFMGSGSTGKAALLEGFRFIGIEKEEEYLEIANRRLVEVYLNTMDEL
ncbi:MAG: site-specific DNA-methyltransferase [Anaerolineaceae bacterium]|nr:site-specific DNA-methyltransferase [Anaerolineaceae bacterium]